MNFLAIILGAAVFCNAPGANGPGSYYTGERIVIDSTLCLALRRRRMTSNATIAVYVLAHEEGHAHDPDALKRDDCNRRGVCEGVADCWAAGHIVQVAQAVGYSRRDALRLRVRVRQFLHGAVSNYGPIPARCWA